MCMCLDRDSIGRDGGEWMKEFGLGFTNPLGIGGGWTCVCVCVAMG